MILKFRDLGRPCLSLAMPPLHHAGEEAGREARGHAAVCLERVSSRPTMPAMPHDRSGASLGKSKICDFEILEVRFGLRLPFLALRCVRSSPMRHERDLEIFTEFILNNCFSSPREAGKRSGGHRVVQGSSPDGPCRHNNHCPTKNFKNHQKT